MCLQGYPYAMDTTGPAKRRTAKPERREERVQTPSSHPSLFQSLDFSPSHTVHLFSSLPPHTALCFYSPSNKSTNISICLFLFFFLFRHRSWPKLILWSSVSPLALITHHAVWERNKANLISQANWQPETMRWWVHWWAVWTSRVTRQIPGLFVATCDKRGLGECLDDTDSMISWSRHFRWRPVC